MMRLPDWKPRLTEYLGASSQRVFAYGSHDCCLFAAGAVDAMTGVDIAAPYRGRYTTLKGGLRLLRKGGFADYVALAVTHFTEVHSAFAAPGDLAVIDTAEGAVLGVFQGEGIYVLGLGRVGLMPMSAARVFLAVP